MSTADYQRAWRAKQGARTGQPGRPAVQPCGTPAAYARHLRNDEQPCDACREANNKRHRDRYAAARETGRLR